MSTLFTKVAKTIPDQNGRRLSMGIEDQIINTIDMMAIDRFQNKARLAEFCGVTNADLSRCMIAVRLANTATSMQPTLWSGDIVLVHLGEKTVDYPGKIWLVKDPDNEGKIKRVSIKHLPQEKDDQITSYSDNATEYPPDVYSLNRHFLGKWDNAIIGRVLWGWTDLTRK